MNDEITSLPDGTFEIRIFAVGQGRIRIPLGKDPKFAREIALEVRMRRKHGCPLTDLASFAAAELGQPTLMLGRRYATIKEVLDAAREAAREVIAADERLSSNAHRAELHLIQFVMLAENPSANVEFRGRGECSIDDFPSVASKSLTILTPAALEKVRKALRGSHEEGSDGFLAAERLLGLMLASFRFLFGPVMLEEYRKRYFAIPELKDVIYAELTNSEGDNAEDVAEVERGRGPPSDDTITKSHHAVAMLKAGDPVLFNGAALALRNGATGTELEGFHSTHYDGRFISFRPGTSFERWTTAVPDIHNILTGRPVGFLFGDTPSARNVTHRLLSRKLEEFGLNGVPDLRASFVRFVVTRFSAAALPAMAGFRSQQAIAHCHKWPRLSPEQLKLWLNPL